MTLRDFERIKLAVPPVDEQKVAIDRCSALLDAARDAEERREATRAVKSTLLSSIWGVP